MELAALERLKISHRLVMGKWFLQASSFTFDWIFVKLPGIRTGIKSQDEFKFRTDQIRSVTSELHAFVGELNFH